MARDAIGKVGGTVGVPRMLRSAPRLRRDALLIRGPSRATAMGPGSAEQREKRCTASGTPVVRLHSEMLAQLQALRLIVGADALAVHGMGPGQHFLIYQPADDLAVLEDERHLARAHFQHCARALPAGAGIAEAGIEEAGIMHAECADQWVERHHLRGIVG